MAAGSGEEVSPDVISAYNRKSSKELNRIYNAGISSQRKALINDILYRRESGLGELSATTKGASAYSEAREVPLLAGTLPFSQAPISKVGEKTVKIGGKFVNIPAGSSNIINVGGKNYGISEIGGKTYVNEIQNEQQKSIFTKNTVSTQFGVQSQEIQNIQKFEASKDFSQQNYKSLEGAKKGKEFIKKQIQKTQPYIDTFLEKDASNIGKFLPIPYNPIPRGTTYKDILKESTKITSLPSKGADLLVDYATETQKKINKASEAVEFSVKDLNPTLGEVFYPSSLEPYRKVKRFTSEKGVEYGGRLPLYLVPILGEALMASDLSASVEEYISAKETAKKYIPSYEEYVKVETPKLEENQRVLTAEEYTQAMTELQPQIESGIKEQALISGAGSIGFLGSAIGLKVFSSLKGLKRFKYETANFNEANKIYQEQMELAQYVPIIEKSGKTFSVEKSNFEQFNKMGISNKILENADSLKVSLSTQEIAQKVPKINKIKVPEESPLFKKTDYIYSVDSTNIKTSYRNSVDVAVRGKNGETNVFTLSFITNKPLSKFNNLENALKYSRNNRVAFSRISEDSEILKTGVYRIKGGKLKAEGKYFTKARPIDINQLPRREGLNVVPLEEPSYYGGETKKVGKAKDISGMQMEELFEISPTTGKTIIKIKSEKQPLDVYDLETGYGYQRKFERGRFMTKTEPLIMDLSISKKMLQDTQKFRKGKNKLIKKIPLSKTFGETEPIQKQTQIQKRTPQELIKTSKIPLSIKEEIIRDVGKERIRVRTKVMKPKLKTRVKESALDFAKGSEKSLYSSLNRSSQQVGLKERQKNKQLDIQKDTNVVREIQEGVQSIKQEEKLYLKGKLISKDLKIVPDFRLPNIPKIPKIRRDIPKKPPIRIPLIKTKGKQLTVKSKKTAQSYDVYVKPPKSKQYVKVTKKPVSLMDAKDTRNFFLDETTSRQGYLKPRTDKPSKSNYIIPKGYGGETQNKFRTFKQKKGKRKSLQPERVIEKNPYLIDTQGEKKQLSIFKLMAQKEKKRVKSKRPVGLSFA